MLHIDDLKEATKVAITTHGAPKKSRLPEPQLARAFEHVGRVFGRIGERRWPIAGFDDLPFMVEGLRQTYAPAFNVSLDTLAFSRLREYHVSFAPGATMRKDVRDAIIDGISREALRPLSAALLAAPSVIDRLAASRPEGSHEAALEAFAPTSALFEEAMFRASLEFVLTNDLGSLGPLAARQVVAAMQEILLRTVIGDQESLDVAIHFLDSCFQTFIVFPHDTLPRTYVIVGR